MIYNIPSFWTTNGYSVSKPGHLSAVDNEGIASLYPKESRFTVETSVNCHRLEVLIRHGVWKGSSVHIKFKLDSNDQQQQLTGFKRMSIPLHNNEATARHW